MRTSLLWIFAVLCIIRTGGTDLTKFPKNFVAVKMRNNATLTCGTKIDGDIIWKFHDGILDDVPFETNVDLDSQNLTVFEVETPVLGEYSCWKGEEKLSSTYLLLDQQESLKTEYLNCRAKSYDCTFSCTWTHRRDTAVRLGLGHDCKKGEKSCQWVTSTNRNENGEFQFELSHSLSPYAEESTMLEVTAEAIVDLSILKETKTFYLRDIVQPDSPQIVKCQEAEQGLNVTIEPPSSWSTPHSFFRLEHEIEYELRDDGTINRSLSSLIPDKKISKLRVHSRDSLIPSHWSQWTPWKHVRTKKKLCKCKNTAKYCCPELSTEALEHCQKKKKKKGKKIQTS